MSQEPAPEVQGVPVTARNWQDAPANRWAFWHVGDLLPTYRVPRGDGQARPLPAAPGRPDLLSVPVTRMDRTAGLRRPAPWATCSAIPTPTPTWCCRTGSWSPSGTARWARRTGRTR